MRTFGFLFAVFLKGVSADQRVLFEAVEPHMGTLVRIKLFSENPQQAKSAFRAAFDRIHQLDQILSDYKPDSELNTICRTAVGHSVTVSDELFRVLAASQQLAEESGGAFDITLGPVIRLWRKARDTGELPAAAALRDAALRCGYRKLHLNTIDRSVRLEEPDMQLDLGGIAKGFAADEAIAVLTRLGIHNALVAASGDLVFSDAPPGKAGWKVGLASGRVMELSNAAVSTSGDTEQHLDIAGTRFSHIIDPATQKGLTSGISVTVVARQGKDADGLATAVSVLGAERGQAMIQKHPGVTAWFFVSTGRRQQ